jgi:hypothetical protein
MKKLFLTSITTLLLATGTVHSANAERFPPPDHSQCTNCRTAKDHKFFSCVYYYLMRHRQQDPEQVRQSSRRSKPRSRRQKSLWKITT